MGWGGGRLAWGKLIFSSGLIFKGLFGDVFEADSFFEVYA